MSAGTTCQYCLEWCDADTHVCVEEALALRKILADVQPRLEKLNMLEANGVDNWEGAES